MLTEDEITWSVRDPQYVCCCILQDRKNRELGAENGKLQREVAKLTEHERQLEQVGRGVVCTSGCCCCCCCRIPVTWYAGLRAV
jgi:hypothetical protein